MSSPLSADLLTAVEDEAVEMVMAVLRGVVDELQVDGRAYGDVELSRGDRILDFENAVESGEMDSLVVVNPKLAREMADEYERDIAASPVFAGGR